MNRRLTCLLSGVLAAAAAAATGCSQYQPNPEHERQLRERALDCLKRGVGYEWLPTVRVQSVEALQKTAGEQALPWIRHGLHDEHPAVRFAAALALGQMEDRVAAPAIRKLLDSEVASDRIAAIFALHRLGDVSHTVELASYLLESEDPTNQRHAALVLGRLKEKGAVKLLARSMRSRDTGVRLNALEAMALLGREEARSELYAMAYSGAGSDETFAVTALGELRDASLRGLYEQKLERGLHVETRLAAARALGMLGDRGGADIARESLGYHATKELENDPVENQDLRVRQLAALACGAIGDPQALPKLVRMMDDADDPRLQVAAAAAILQILGPPRQASTPFSARGPEPGVPTG